jgi:hypothetical protein
MEAFINQFIGCIPEEVIAIALVSFFSSLFTMVTPTSKKGMIGKIILKCLNIASLNVLKNKNADDPAIQKKYFSVMGIL